MSDNYELDFIDPTEGNFNPSKQEYSHSILVMTAVSRCAQNLSKEMTSGYWNEKIDKYGNIARFYIHDSRKEFIGSVESLLALLDDGKEILKEINDSKNLIKEVEKLKNKYLLMEAKDWETCPKIIKDLRMNQGLRYRQGLFCSKLPYENEYILSCVEIYKKIFNKLVIVAREENTTEGIDEGGLTSVKIDRV